MSLPIGAAYAAPVPHGRTAQRLTWEFLPPGLRTQITQRLGSEVVCAESQNAGFTPGFASLLTGADGDQVFVKAASRVAQAPFAAAYAEEARVLRALDGRLPAPRLHWVINDEWTVLGIEAVPHRRPARPWDREELGRALDLCEQVAAELSQPPPGLDLEPVYDDQPAFITGWRRFAAVELDWPHLIEASELADALPEVPMTHLVHCDLRDDNVLLADDGRTLACDWNHPALGPAWLDAVTLLISAHGDGLPADELLSQRAFTRDADPDHIDRWLAAVAGFMLDARERPSPQSSPYLQTHCNWWAEAAWGWLAQRRGWN